MNNFQSLEYQPRIALKEAQLFLPKNIVVSAPVVVFFRYVCNVTYGIPFPFNTKNGKEHSSHDHWHYVVPSIDIISSWLFVK